MPTPTAIAEGGRIAPAMGYRVSDVALLDEDGIVLFTGDLVSALGYMERHDLIMDWNCEVVRNRRYRIGMEAF